MTTREKIAFGDFQTPRELADEVVGFLRKAGVSPSLVIEPTCGLGSFVLAAVNGFPSVKGVQAYDINQDYVSRLRKEIRRATNVRHTVVVEDFFEFDWKGLLNRADGEILVIGNPPWVTNSALGVLGSENLPQKSNFQNHSGFASKTGKANFDISEWMLIRLLTALDGLTGSLAMLCKTSTARKVLKHCWIHRLRFQRASIHIIDAAAHFGVSVDACLLFVRAGSTGLTSTADVFSGLSFDEKRTTFGLIGKELVANVDEYNLLKSLDGHAQYTWRSGVKHDAAAVMELKPENGGYVNGHGEHVSLESKYLYPMLKSSDLANSRLAPHRVALLTQQKPSDDTHHIANLAPKTWAYLTLHAAALDRRQSIIYRKRARFSVFGVGEYTFSRWKVAISGLYKNCQFQVVGPCQNRPVVFDDTCYFIPCGSEEEAEFVAKLLNSEVSKRFLHSLVFFDAKRPVTIDILNRIDLESVADAVGLRAEARKYFGSASSTDERQGLLALEERAKYKAESSRPTQAMRKRAPSRKRKSNSEGA